MRYIYCPWVRDVTLGELVNKQMEEKTKVDPGWNDPPMLNYSTTNPPHKSRITTKRVAFPLNNTGNMSTTKSQLTSAELSPPKLPCGAPSSPALSISDPQPNRTFSHTKENLYCFLKSDEDKLLFTKAWEEGNLSNECKSTIDLLAKSLAENDKATATEIKVKLMTHHEQACHQWLNSIDV